ncbi:hypothetical protein COV53_02840 [Candidatus Gottesmanbacteria bacterium CG11_big_fil_rev_8_21_14_0_20_37_11]|uniref:Uncharacterized protein n=1 Tax=Candidatus Gottesmanbacteria bacterium CG11_big_fil_rev_8_21_14_0_20_37_11 TaxID=1974575 RepID=A0A2H0NJS5_9BACT|nr:MAG: hypothetical protein COV53_02840 [Candidatus Gottesmanbacteria bacterium CG11_big_fil_rev_8_21_14_0_20_37_11]
MSGKIENNVKNIKNEIIIFFILALWAAFLLMILLFIRPAQAQMNNEAWGFKQQNRASIAALMQQVENKDSNNGAVTGAYAGYDQLVCGGDGQSSATGNSTCIIMNNSDGAIQIGQDAQGSQDATTSENTTINAMSEALEIPEQ